METFALPKTSEVHSSLFVLTDRVLDAQPFGALGGMPRSCEYLGLRVPVSRVHIEYTLNACQNAHAIILVVGESSDGVDQSNDALIQSVHFAAASDERRTSIVKDIPNFDHSLAMHTAKEGIEHCTWVPTSSVGRYGPDQQRTLKQLHSDQLSAYAIETAHASKSLNTGVCGFATVTIERGPEQHELRTLRAEETAIAAQYVSQHINDCIATAKDEVRNCKPAFRWALEKRLASLTAKLPTEEQRIAEVQEVSAAIRGSNDPNGSVSRIACAANSSTAVLHMSVVAGHPGNKGAGKRAIETLCKLADAADMPIILEALPNDKLPLYYARNYGFVAVTLGPANVTAATLQRQGFIIMWRDPVNAAGAAAAPSAELSVTRDALTKAVTQLAESGKVQRYATRQRNSKLQALHLSPATTRVLNGRLIYNTKNVLLSYATWAKEYVRQVKEGVTPVLFYPPSDEELAKLEDEESSAASCSKGTVRRNQKRSRDDEGDSELRVRTANQPLPTSGTLTLPFSPLLNGGAGATMVLHLTNCTVNIYMGASR